MACFGSLAFPAGRLLALLVAPSFRKGGDRPNLRKIAKARASGAATVDDDYHRRSELLFERLAVRWEIAGLPIEGQKLLLARYRMADSQTQRWVRRTLADHVARLIPELAE